MAQGVNVTIYDGASTPVARALIFDGVERPDANTQLAIWREAYSSASLNLQPKLLIKKQKLKSGTIVQTLDLTVPVQENTSGGTAEGYVAPPKAAYTDRVLIIQYQDPRSTIASRRLARQLALNFASNVTTSVTPSATGFWPEAADMSIFPT